MIKKLLFSLLFAISLSASLEAAERGFAIIIDNDTYGACKAQIEDYRAVLEREGLSAVVIARVWSDPVQVRDVLHKMYLTQGLEGAVFIGNIPIPMIRDAQHLTSAFKMDQELNPFLSSSVPSDRFYDDFDLRFDYLGVEKENPLYHYYSLRYDSPQFIKSDIYSGRIKPTKRGEEGYQQIRDYFVKLLKERNKENRLDNVTAYTGEGSFSNSITAWRDGGFLMKEQFPLAYREGGSAKSLFFAMEPYMKEMIIDELRREELDIMLFHQHGMPHRMYLTGALEPKGESAYFDAAKALFAQTLSRIKTKEERDERVAKWSKYYNIDSTWFIPSPESEEAKKDSIKELKTGINIEEVATIAPNARVVLFDACYNGDFREESYIAGEFIFSPGKSLVTFANSVNVLQDKSSTDLIGMLTLGYSIGEWAREVNILESHIFGDPTFRFSPLDNKKLPDLNSKESGYWLDLLKSESYPDLIGLALHKLFWLEYRALPQLLSNIYFTSPWYSVRLQVYHLLQYYRGDAFANILEYSVFDPYEFIRRKSLYSMGRIGENSFIPFLTSVYLNDNLDQRVYFNATMAFDLVDPLLLEEEMAKQIEATNSYFNKEEAIRNFKSHFASRLRIAAMTDDISNKEKSLKARLQAVSILRNNPYHNRVDSYLSVIADTTEEEALRASLAEALGWFTLSREREKIVKRFREVASYHSTPDRVKKELLKSVSRIETYMR